MNLRSFNTSLFLLYLLTLFLYWTKTIPSLNNNPLLYMLSTAIMVLMTIVFYSQIIGRKVFNRDEQCLLFIFSFLMLLHMLFSQTSIFQGLNIIFVVYLYLVLPKVPFKTTKIYKVILGSFVVLIIVLIPQVIRGLLELSNEYAAFRGVFLSSNSIGDFGVSALLAYLLIDKTNNKHKRKSLYLFVLFLIITIISSHQRSALLLLIAWVVTHYLLEKRWNKKIIFAGFVITLIAIGSYMIISEVVSIKNSESGVVMFGKEATSRGRSEQMYVALQLYDITPLGEGRGVVNAAVQDEVQYAIHNMFVGSLLEYGYLIFIFYFVFWFRLFKQGSSLSASFILSYHIILFFEPETFFSNQLLPFIAFSLVLLSEGERISYNKNYSLNTQLDNGSVIDGANVIRT